MERLEMLFNFFREIDREKKILRQTLITGGDRQENDAEHAWHAAVMTILLSEYSEEKIDILKTVSMLLIHDVVEVDAGDTFAYDEEAKKTQRQREQKAADRLFGMLPHPESEKFRNLWEEFEASETAEAKFAHAMDNLQPMMLNAANNGKSWNEWKVNISQILKRNEITPKASRVLWDYALDSFLIPNIEAGNIADDMNILKNNTDKEE